jgi:hypothetical protein
MNASVILRANPGMIRDAFITEDKSLGDEGPILAIRQVKFNGDGSDGETKLIRLTKAETEALITFWRDVRITKP